LFQFATVVPRLVTRVCGIHYAPARSVLRWYRACLGHAAFPPSLSNKSLLCEFCQQT